MNQQCFSDNDINLYCKSQFESIKEDIRAIKNSVCGNGNKVGLDKRVDRLEQAQADKSKLSWLVTGCLVVVLVNSTWALVMRLLGTLVE